MREVLVKVEYHGQVWYVVKTIKTMGTAHGTQTTRREREGYHPSKVIRRNEDEADRL